jgi:hypothetical protein
MLQLDRWLVRPVRPVFASPVENDKSSLFSGELFGTIAQDLRLLLGLIKVAIVRIGGVIIVALLIDRLRVGELIVEESGQFKVHG